jgi:hypothetical protein
LQNFICFFELLIVDFHNSLLILISPQKMIVDVDSYNQNVGEPQWWASNV